MTPSRERLAESLTEGWRALDHFTDRFAAVRRFAAALNDDPAPGAVLFFHGDGGNGKSLLMRHLRSRCAKRFEPDNWRYLAGLADNETAEQIVDASDAAAVPVAHLDFALGTEDVLARLEELQRGLAPRGFRFPLFTYARVRYWQQAGELTKERLHRSFPDQELSFALALADALGQAVPFAGLFFTVKNLASRHLGSWFDDYRLRRGLDEALVETIARLDYRTELVAKLPVLFAEDLNAGMAVKGAPPRVALFFDTHERFRGDARVAGSPRDEWFQRLLGALDRSRGIVCVAAGREPPGWPASLPVETIEIGDFADRDARGYLERLGLAADAPRLLDLARSGSDRVHPYLLGLVADTALANRNAAVAAPSLDRAGIAEKSARLVDRFLHYVDDETAYAVRALAACRAFTFARFRLLGQERGFAATRPRFDALVRYSFVRPADPAESEDEPSFRLHDLLRRLLHDRADAETLAAHAILETEARDRAEADPADHAAAAEAIYHANQRDPARGVAAWTEAMEHAVRGSFLGRCRALLDTVGDLRVPSARWEGRIAFWQGQYAGLIAENGRAETAYRSALAAFARAAAETPDNAEASRGRGGTANALGVLLVRSARFDEARAVFDAGIVDLDAAIGRSPDDAALRALRGTIGQSLANLLVRRGDPEAAERTFRASIASFENALALAAPAAATLNNLGGSHLGLAMLLTGQDRLPEVVDHLEAAVAGYDRALALSPDHVPAATNRAIAFSLLGDLHDRLGNRDAAAAAYADSVAAYDLVLSLAPDAVAVHINKSATLQALAEHQDRRGALTDAAASYRAAAAASDEALRRAPANVTALLNKGASLSALAEGETRLGDVAAARTAATAALAAFAAALAAAPDSTEAAAGRERAMEIMNRSV